MKKKSNEQVNGNLNKKSNEQMNGNLNKKSNKKSNEKEDKSIILKSMVGMTIGIFLLGLSGCGNLSNKLGATDSILTTETQLEEQVKTQTETQLEEQLDIQTETQAEDQLDIQTGTQTEDQIDTRPVALTADTKEVLTNNQKEIQTETAMDLHSYDFTICFAGDINFDENWPTTQYLNTCENGIEDCISKELIAYMRDADFMCLNNEFTYSNRGTPTADKMYTFRANPERVQNLTTLGVDLVSLANNHAHDYGRDSLIDTMDTLTKAGIPYVGAGNHLEEAMTPYYTTIQGKTIAFVAASRAEKHKRTPQATENRPGILRCYDTTLFDQVIKEASEKADIVIAYVHWGTEGSDILEPVQRETAKEYLDMGADVVIGAHPHCLQGMEYIDGKPVVYSLGNYWFNAKTLDTMLLYLHFYGDDEEQNVKLQILPALQKNCKTTYVSEPEERDRLFRYLESISYDLTIDDEGNVCPMK